MNMDYNDMTDEQFGDVFGTDWVKME
jgi:hypothetical protein